MGTFLNLLLVASMPVLKVLLISGIGLFLALNHIDILGDNARHHLNRVVFYVFSPAMVGSYLAKTVTFKSFLNLWFMPVNILMTFFIGSAMGWVLAKVTRASKHSKGIILASCSAGNTGILVIIIVSALCKEKSSPFGAPDVCEAYGLAYASVSMAVGAIYLWLYVYNILRISSRELVENTGANGFGIKGDNKVETLVNVAQAQHVPSSDQPCEASQKSRGDTLALQCPHTLEILPKSSSNSKFALSIRAGQCLRTTFKKSHLKALLAPSTVGAMIGFSIGMISLLRKLIIGNNAPLHVIGDTASVIGDAAVPSMTLILGANLLKGLKGSGVPLKIVVGIMIVRYIFLPLLGILIVRGAIHAGFVASHDRLFQFVLILQYSLPPAMSIGTITQLFGAGQSECSVIMLWTYASASVALTLWCTVYLWLV